MSIDPGFFYHGFKRRFCPTCRQEGRKSRVYQTFPEHNLAVAKIVIEPYWDEEGNYVPGVYPPPEPLHFRCSNNHFWDEEEIHPV